MRTTAIMVALVAIVGCQEPYDDSGTAPEIEVLRSYAGADHTRVVTLTTDIDGDLGGGSWESTFCGYAQGADLDAERCSDELDLDLTWYVDIDGQPASTECMEANDWSLDWPIRVTVCDVTGRCGTVTSPWGMVSI